MLLCWEDLVNSSWLSCLNGRWPMHMIWGLRLSGSLCASPFDKKYVTETAPMEWSWLPSWISQHSAWQQNADKRLTCRLLCLRWLHQDAWWCWPPSWSVFCLEPELWQVCLLEPWSLESKWPCPCPTPEEHGITPRNTSRQVPSQQCVPSHLSFWDKCLWLQHFTLEKQCLKVLRHHFHL